MANQGNPLLALASQILCKACHVRSGFYRGWQGTRILWQVACPLFYNCMPLPCPPCVFNFALLNAMLISSPAIFPDKCASVSKAYSSKLHPVYQSECDGSRLRVHLIAFTRKVWPKVVVTRISSFQAVLWPCSSLRTAANYQSRCAT